ncbi:hypothetical protein CCACVL1_22130 [Corchorus capsularis]|uniref:Uncharacterized protein n=1 Tax=Corchorus capsularis TaxID=210143 RepID=A0A1R3H100_COCAP|nr:hypothetical protein CCACVL1_22130 [Corchorus capsularis]
MSPTEKLQCGISGMHRGDYFEGLFLMTNGTGSVAMSAADGEKAVIVETIASSVLRFVREELSLDSKVCCEARSSYSWELKDSVMALRASVTDVSVFSTFLSTKRVLVRCAWADPEATKPWNIDEPKAL